MCRWPRRVKLQAMTVTAHSSVPSDLSTSRKATAISVPKVSSSTTVPNSSQPRPDLYRDPQTLWGTLAETAMHQRRLPLACHPSARTSAPTCTELANTPEFAKAQRQRKKVEALFAELKNQIGLRRLRSRRLKFVRGEVLPGSGSAKTSSAWYASSANDRSRSCPRPLSCSRSRGSYPGRPVSAGSARTSPASPDFSRPTNAGSVLIVGHYPNASITRHT